MKKHFSSISWLFILLTICFASSCKTAKKAKVDAVNASALQDIISKIEDTTFRPEWFKAKAQIQSRIDGKGMSFTSTIISKNEEVLWMNGKKFGMEGARFMFTTDSLFAIIRLNRQYLAEEINWVSDEFDLPAILSQALDLKHIQDIFIGNPILDIIPYTEIIPKETETLLKGTKDSYHSELMINSASMQARYFTLTQGENMITVKYSDYRTLESGHNFAHRRDIIVNQPNAEDVQLSILYDNISINKPQDIKFNIPGNYSRM